MGSGDAKRFRNMYDSAGRQGESFWSEEKDNVGMKLLQSMGWERGQGLGKDGDGSTAHVKQFRKKDMAGIGATAGTRDAAFLASQDLFQSVLGRLSGTADGSGGGPGDDDGATELGGAATSMKGMVAKRSLTTRFRRAKVEPSRSHRSVCACAFTHVCFSVGVRACARGCPVRGGRDCGCGWGCTCGLWAYVRCTCKHGCGCGCGCGCVTLRLAGEGA